MEHLCRPRKILLFSQVSLRALTLPVARISLARCCAWLAGHMLDADASPYVPYEPPSSPPAAPPPAQQPFFFVRLSGEALGVVKLTGTERLDALRVKVQRDMRPAMERLGPGWHFLILGAPIYECQEKEYTAEEVAVARSITLAASSEPLTRESLAEAKGRLAAAGAMRSSNAANTDEQQAGGAKAEERSEGKPLGPGRGPPPPRTAVVSRRSKAAALGVSSVSRRRTGPPPPPTGQPQKTSSVGPRSLLLLLNQEPAAQAVAAVRVAKAKAPPAAAGRSRRSRPKSPPPPPGTPVWLKEAAQVLSDSGQVPPLPSTPERRRLDRGNAEEAPAGGEVAEESGGQAEKMTRSLPPKRLPYRRVAAGRAPGAELPVGGRRHAAAKPAAQTRSG